MNPILIIEGVTGSGKSTLIRRLVAELGERAIVIYEDETLGTIMEDIKRDNWKSDPTFPALDTTMQKIRELRLSDPGKTIIVERFHLTAYALHPDWEVLKLYDDQLHNLGAKLILLTIPTEEIGSRSIDRPDDPNYAEVMITYYGSREKAIEQVRISQQRRIDALEMTKLRTSPQLP